MDYQVDTDAVAAAATPVTFSVTPPPEYPGGTAVVDGSIAAVTASNSASLATVHSEVESAVGSLSGADQTSSASSESDDARNGVTLSKVAPA